LERIVQGILPRSFSRRRQIVLFGLFLFLTSSALQPAGVADVWTDSTGKHSMEAEFLALEGDKVVLRGQKGNRISILLSKLDSTSRLRAEKLGNLQGDAPVDGILATISKANDLEKIALKQRTASRALNLYTKFLNQPGIDPVEKSKAEDRLENWRERDSNKFVRWGVRWETVEQIQQHFKDEERLLSEAHRLMEINNDEMAREKFEEASAVNSEEIRSDFYLGILHLLVGYHSRTAVEHFDECVKRLEMSEDRLTGARRSNLIAALNNRAICHVRNKDHAKALKDWDRAIRLAPLTPELAQNLGYYSRLVSMMAGWRVNKRITKDVTDQYATVAVANESAPFQDNVGWLIIPYVDAPTLPDFESIDLINVEDPTLGELMVGGEKPESDFRVVGWATAFAVDNQHLLTARRAVQGAPGIWLRQDGRLVKENPGKIVAVSGSYDLALVRFKDLNAQPMPIAAEEAKRGVDISIASYAEPGILADGIQIGKGTVVDLEEIYVPLGMQYFTREASASNSVRDGVQTVTDSQSVRSTIAVPLGENYITGIIHDVQLNIGSAGSPLVNAQGKVIGLDLGRRSYEDPKNRSAIVHSEIRRFLASTSVSNSIESVSGAEVSDVGEYLRSAADKSIFQIAIVARVPRLSWTSRIGDEMRGISKLTDWNAYEDDSCMLCSGKGDIACHARGCVEGRVGHKEDYVAGRLPGTGKPIIEWEMVYEDCATCGGKGFLRCHHCGGNGIEPTIR
jgi:tetratricopeptide (TPR) repeat protein